MEKYDPMLDVDSEQWEALDTDERINFVMEYHQEAGTEAPPDEYSHALLHVVVENQIALGNETPVETAFHRLLDGNLDRHDAIHAIASVLVNQRGYRETHGREMAAWRVLGRDRWLTGVIFRLRSRS
jgi:hypothetical protein